MRAEPGSFRDPDSRVFLDGEGGVYRALSAAGLADFEALRATRLWREFAADGRLIGSEPVARDAAPAGLLAERPAAVLRHERIPFVSYPYEWPFSMLKDAALLDLDLNLAALAEGMILKDSSPYNVQFGGARPVFIDVGSFERLRDGEPWAGDREFCMLYLYPLVLQALKGVAPQPWLRGSLGGIDPEQMRGLMSFRDRFRRGLYVHVFLHAKLERRHAERGGEVREELGRAGFKKELIVANVRRLRKLVEGLDWSPPSDVWLEYGERNSYSDADVERKEAFVRAVCGERHRRLTWDLGANNGRYARIAAESADQVVAIDAAQGPIELLYRDLRERGEERILPLTVELADPSPGLGWRGLERRALVDRGRPELVLALALVHHISLAGNVPLAEVVRWLASLDADAVVEFPTREDPMVAKLLARKRAGLHPDYELEGFERLLAEAFDVERRERLASGTRLLYYARPKGTGSPIDLTRADA